MKNRIRMDRFRKYRFVVNRRSRRGKVIIFEWIAVLRIGWLVHI